jgi:spore coat polysaccharide biosynthesis protein SpsF (cytidylyltransferase family)
MKTVAILQARMGSKRLPGKSMKLIDQIPMIEVLMRRLDKSEIQDRWLATTTAPEDEELATLASRLGWQVFRGCEHDVLSRFVSIAEVTNAAVIVRLTGDNPMMHHVEVDAAVRQFLVRFEPKLASVGDYEPRVLPMGLVPEVTNSHFLSLAAHEIPPDAGHHRSHVTSWFRGRYLQSPFESHLYHNQISPEWRWTVDTPEDLQTIRNLVVAAGPRWLDLTVLELAAAYLENIDTIQVNRGIRVKDLRLG